MIPQLLTIAALASVAIAAPSSQCVSALASVISNPDASACFAAPDLVPFLTGGSNSSDLTLVDSILTKICAASACHNDTIAAIVTNITDGCVTELDRDFGLGPGRGEEVIAAVQRYYLPVRGALCLKEGDQHCLTKTLASIQPINSNLSDIRYILSTWGNELFTLPNEVFCSDCLKAGFTFVAQLTGPDAGGFNFVVEDKCGADFLDGTTPSGITPGHNTAIATPTQPAPDSSSSGAALWLRASWSTGVAAALSASALVVISSAFAVLA